MPHRYATHATQLQEERGTGHIFVLALNDTSAKVMDTFLLALIDDLGTWVARAAAASAPLGRPPLPATRFGS